MIARWLKTKIIYILSLVYEFTELFSQLQFFNQLWSMCPSTSVKCESGNDTSRSLSEDGTLSFYPHPFKVGHTANSKWKGEGTASNIKAVQQRKDEGF